MMAFCEIEYGSVEYRQTVTLRERLLRRPLGLCFTEQQLAEERHERHFALTASGEVVACVVASPAGPGRVRLRQMAVDDGRQRQGLGKRLLREVESCLAADGVAELTLHARDNAVSFYEKLGYRPVGESFVEVTISHQAMTKTIAPLKQHADG